MKKVIEMVKNAAEKVIGEFTEFSKFPHGSGNEKKVGEYLLDWARKRNIECFMDSYGNVIMEKEASAGCENAPLVILQSHMDMVCVAESGKDFDAANDSIEIYRDGDFLKAKGTSLGADDGAGVAMMLYLLSEDGLKMPPVRAIFTVEEETSMRGAENLDIKYLDGEYLLNLDWEEKDSISSSCSNTVEIIFESRVERKECGKKGVEIKISDLLGGHSGCDINLPRANAIKMMGALLFELENEGVDFELSDFTGGRVMNAICAECSAKIVTSDTAKVGEIAARIEKQIKDEYKNEENASVTISECVCDSVVGKEDCDKLVGFLMSVHSGVFYMSKFTPDFVETSQNIGIVRLGEKLRIEILARSSSAFHSEERKKAAKSLAKIYGYDLYLPSENPIWEEKGENELIRIMKRAYLETIGEELKVGGVHAGLECAFFSSVKPNLQMVSVGAQLYDVHTPKERWEISSLDDTMNFIIRALEIIAE